MSQSKRSSNSGPKCMFIWGFPKIRGTLLGGPIIRTRVFWGLDWVLSILGSDPLHVYAPGSFECTPTLSLEQLRSHGVPGPILVRIIS